MTSHRTALVIPGSAGCWHVPHQSFAVDAARARGAQVHHVSWRGEVPAEPQGRGPWAVEQVAAALHDLPEPLLIASSLGTVAAGLAADHGLPADHGLRVPGPLARSAAVLGEMVTAVGDFLDRVLWPAPSSGGSSARVGASA